MVLTCYHCPSQIAFAGKNVKRYAGLFGWHLRRGRYFCGWCA